MRYSVPLKFIAILLTALALTVCFVCTLGIVQAETFDLYTRDFDDWVHQRLQWQAYDLGSGLAERHAIVELSNCSTETLRQLGYRHLFEGVLGWSGFSEDQFSYTIFNRDGTVVDSFVNGSVDGFSFEVICSVEYPVLVTNEAAVDRVYGKDYIRTELVELGGYDGAMTVRYYNSSKYTVALTMRQDAALSRYGSSVPLVQALYRLRFTMMWVLALALCLFATGIVYLCCAAGRTAPDTPPQVGGLSGLPLDVYAVVGTGLGALMASVVVSLVRNWLASGKDFNHGNLVIVSLLLLGASVILIGFIYALVAQIKLHEGYWWRRMWLRKLVLAVQALLRRMPIIWKHLLLAVVMAAGVVGTAVLAWEGTVVPLVLVLLACGAIVCYGAYAYAILLKGSQRMAKGDLQWKIDTRFLLGSYAEGAEAMNQLADVATVAARKQMRAERMRTELITNVSHDIKTPLTSIISYVDLLQRADTREEAEQYLEVLGRQSQRMKKLIEDLMELSKASSGTMAVDIIQLDMNEAVYQALGEFSDKLQQAGMTAVFEQPEQPVLVRADGRLTWRVLSNLLSNVVKYALPGTRVYLDVLQTEEFTEVSVKNISAQPLNVSAEELMERFVRGDASRNTEGSGLGLNIAKSLMELQKGVLELKVDGDLFKAILRFPNAQ